jgi:hypothetical protein
MDTITKVEIAQRLQRLPGCVSFINMRIGERFLVGIDLSSKLDITGEMLVDRKKDEFDVAIYIAKGTGGSA